MRASNSREHFIDLYLNDRPKRIVLLIGQKLWIVKIIVGVFGYIPDAETVCLSLYDLA